MNSTRPASMGRVSSPAEIIRRQSSYVWSVTGAARALGNTAQRRHTGAQAHRGTYGRTGTQRHIQAHRHTKAHTGAHAHRGTYSAHKHTNKHNTSTQEEWRKTNEHGKEMSEKCWQKSKTVILSYMTATVHVTYFPLFQTFMKRIYTQWSLHKVFITLNV